MMMIERRASNASMEVHGYKSHFVAPNMHQMGILPPRFLPHHQQQPPLLPLPAATHRLARGLSCPKTPTKKPKSPTKKATKIKSPIVSLSTSPKDVNIMYRNNNTDILGSVILPETRITRPGPSCTVNKNKLVESNMFSGSVVDTTVSPPPSSLPLPTFSIRPKLSCKVQAGGIDAGATDDLRRLLRIY